MWQETPLLKRISLATLVAVLVLSGCGGPAYVNKERLQDVSVKHFSLTVPIGWVKYRSAGRTQFQSVVMTKDGTLVHSIKVSWIEWDTPIPDRKDGFKFRQREAPLDMVEQVVAMMSGSSHSNLLEVRSVVPATFAGMDAFRMQWSYIADDGLGSGLRIQGVTYGAVDDRGFYFAEYSAPATHFFERDIATFEDVTTSVQTN